MPTLSIVIFLLDPLYFVGKSGNLKSLDEFEIWPDQTLDCGVRCLECQEKNTYNERIAMTTLDQVSSFLYGSSLFLYVTRTNIKVWRLILGKIPSLTMELAALEHLKNQCKML